MAGCCHVLDSYGEIAAAGEDLGVFALSRCVEGGD